MTLRFIHAIIFASALIALVMGALLHAQSAPAPAQSAPVEQVVAVFDEASIEWDKNLADGTRRDELLLFKQGQAVQRTLDLPPRPSNQRDARRIVATVIVEPVIHEEDGKMKSADPWTRLGSLSVIKPGVEIPEWQTNQRGTPSVEVELMRFITGFGGQSTFTQDVTALAPLLSGQTTLRVSISTYKKPAWKVTVTLTYATDSAGYRRPVWAAPVFNEESITSDKNKISATIDVPPGLARPRLRIISTGHATDGIGGDEFISRMNILRIDGVEVARWRPWSEDGGVSKIANPMSGRVMLDGRELWSSDLDRSGWRPGSVVTPLQLPVPELDPGKHTIELEIVNIRPKDDKGSHGYWRASCIAVADEPWPNDPDPPR